MVKKRAPAKKTVKKAPAKVAASVKASVAKRVAKKKDVSPAPRYRVVFGKWNSYLGLRDDVTMLVAFDDLVTNKDRPADLQLCARVLVPIQSPHERGGPVSPESELLWDMEDELCALLQKDRIRCRLIGRLTYGRWRELVFQVHDWDSFRPPVGWWMMQHRNYSIDVSEHEGWTFFDQYLNPRPEDRIFMSDRSVIEVLIENGSDPDLPHSLEYAFRGDAKGLRRIAKALVRRGYEPLGEMDCDSGLIELAKSMTLDVLAVSQESIANDKAAAKAGVECVGWGALSVN